MKITTNNVPRVMLAAHELPAGVLQSEFDYVSEDDCSERFFRYRGAWYDAHEFTRIQLRGAPGFNPMCTTVDKDDALAQWDGMQSDTYFSGVLLKMVDGGERAIVGRYYA